MEKLVEGLWDCPFCDNKRIKAGQKNMLELWTSTGRKHKILYARCCRICT